MKHYRLMSMFTVFMMVMSVVTPIRAKEEPENCDHPQALQNFPIDTTPVIETNNEKVILYNTMKSGARQTTPYNKAITVNFQTQQNTTIVDLPLFEWFWEQLAKRILRIT